MNRGPLWLLAAATGAGIAYFMDPDRGARRRAILKDKAMSALRTGEEAFGKVQRDFGNRARGLTHQMSSLVESDHPSDPQLVERVRSRMGRFVSHPRAIVVSAQNGVVELSGPILSEEREVLLSSVRSVSGVRDVIDRLEVHFEGENLPALQGGYTARGAPFELAQERWAPAPRFLVGSLGSLILTLGLMKRGRALPATFLGAGLLARSIANRPVRSLMHSRRAMHP